MDATVAGARRSVVFTARHRPPAVDAVELTEEDLMRLLFWRQCAGHSSETDRSIADKIVYLLDAIRAND